VGCAAALLHPAAAENIVFKNGLRSTGRIIARGTDFISVQVDSGLVRYPLASVQTIDGQSLAQSTALAAAPFDLQSSGGKDSQSAQSAPAAVPNFGTGSGQAAAAATPASIPAKPAASEPSMASSQATAASSSSDRWNFDLFLLGFLGAAGIWMRSLQAVQRDLRSRQVDPGFWTKVALIFPGIGALVYAVAKGFSQKVSAFKMRRTRSAAMETGEPDQGAGQPKSGTGMSFPFMRPAVPAPAAAAVSAQGLVFLDGDRHLVAAPGGELASGLDNAGIVLEEALREKASDIHIEPTGDAYRVRFRLDGILHERAPYEPSEGVRLVTAIKSLAQIDVAEKRRAQDGKFRAAIDGREVDFRVATANSVYGEKMVIRVLDRAGGVFDLAALGMSEEMLSLVQSTIHSKNGMILATGPTGSGKTSTLYAALRQLDSSSLNIMTIEDPPEYDLAGATQIAVNPRAGITYEAGLRSILRQDPDVILVGEMRDAEASAVALRSALTGHLVLSSLHTKDAIGTISRLQDMGIERYQVASALLMVLAQRLVRVLCPECRAPYPAVGDELETIGLSFDPGATLYASQGCAACNGTGFRGRTGIFELLVLDEEMRRAIGEGLDEAGLLEMATQRGFRSYRYDGAEKVLLGITTVNEIIQAA
jgi:general secretion pathway protein E